MATLCCILQCACLICLNHDLWDYEINGIINISFNHNHDSDLYPIIPMHPINHGSDIIDSAFA